jgi:hypothetical protein
MRENGTDPMPKYSTCVILIFAIVFTLMGHQTTQPAVAQTAAGPLDGRYVSNMGNYIDIIGENYTYYGTHGGPSQTTGSLKLVSNNQVQFSGYLHYLCARENTVLVCDLGRRVWTKQ